MKKNKFTITDAVQWSRLGPRAMFGQFMLDIAKTNNKFIDQPISKFIIYKDEIIYAYNGNFHEINSINENKEKEVSELTNVNLN